MALQLTLARPYAKAVFADAEEAHQLKIWSAVLNTFSKIIENKQLIQLIANPQISNKDTKELLLHLIQTIQAESNVLKEKIDRLLQLLINRKRLTILPDINFLYHRLLNDYCNTIEAEVICAFPLGANYQSQIKSKLEKRFKSKVNLKIIKDRSLLGGIIVRVDDWVIDSSVRGKLTRLAEGLRSKCI